MTDLVVASEKSRGLGVHALVAGVHTIELGTGLMGAQSSQRFAAQHVRVTARVLARSMKLSGGGAVIGWLDGFASPHFVGKFRVDDNWLTGSRGRWRLSCTSRSRR